MRKTGGSIINHVELLDGEMQQLCRYLTPTGEGRSSRCPAILYRIVLHCDDTVL
jgi:hypothetical protein